MDVARSTFPAKGRKASVQFQVWHLVVLVAFVAIAIANIQDQRMHEPVLIALALAGFVVYGLLGWAGWRLAGGLGSKLGQTIRMILYLVGMATLFLVATVTYLVIEYQYRN